MEKKFDPFSLFDRILLRDIWLPRFDKQNQPGTVRHYLGSLALFFDYLVCDHPIDGVDNDKCREMTSLVKNWSATYKTRVKIRKHEKQVEDFSKLLKSNEYHEFYSSELVEEARQALANAKILRRISSAKQLTLTRGYIISSLILKNATRPGALRNMTLKEFKQAIETSYGSYQVSVKDHKTKYNGPALIMFSSHEFNECSVYISFIRNRLPGIDMSDDAPVFVSWSGRKMSSSLVGEQFSSFFQRATLHNLVDRKNRHLTTTLVRKSFVSKVHGEAPGMKRDLANMMCHGEGTATREYFLQEKMKNAAKTYDQMDSLMMKGSANPDLEDIFSAELQDPKAVTLYQVRDKEALLQNCSESYTQIRDKLRYLQKNKYSLKVTTTTTKKEDMPHNQAPDEEQNDEGENMPYDPASDEEKEVAEEEEEDPSSQLFSEGSEKVGRTIFTARETLLIRDKFNLCITNPAIRVHKSYVKATVKKSEALQLLEKEHSFRSLLIKVRSEKRKYSTR